MEKFKFLLRLPIIILYIIFFFILGIFKIYIFRVDIQRIGHFVGYVTKLNRFQKFKKCRLLILHSNKCSNDYLFDQLKTNIDKSYFINQNKILNTAFYFYSKLFNYNASSLWLKNLYYLNYKDSPIKRPCLNSEISKKVLGNLNLNITDKWVCIFNRDRNYLLKKYPEEDFSHHSYRNYSINDFEDTVQYLIKKGYKVIRVGTHPESEANFKHPNYIDYANSKYQSDFADVLLISNSQFCIFGSSGIVDIALLFNIPVLRINYVPIWDVFKDKYKYSCIFKKYYDEVKGQFLSIEEIFDRKLDKIYYTNDFKKNNIKVINNSKNEILNIVKEFVIFENREIKTKDNMKEYQELNSILSQSKVRYFLNPIEKNFLNNLKILKKT